MTRDELVRIAHAAAAGVFVIARKGITERMLQRARSAAFQAVARADTSTGTAAHPFAAYSVGIAEIAEDGVNAARAAWQEVRSDGGAAGIRARLERPKSTV